MTPFIHALLSECRDWLVGEAAERGGGKGWRVDVLVLPDSLACPVESVGADEAHCEEVVGRAEAARGEVALVNGDSGVSLVFVC